eukprot:TRINITY_DN3916_c5_g1_i1.p1 TRINITY_DN3916_c5_g1~~TRINITY_DN3916_c5_g1_i1.p1  ORF type:complete len:102 (-),score=3.35 TRINITY_DN3916_c5_g1_i1:298-603(-)
MWMIIVFVQSTPRPLLLLTRPPHTNTCGSVGSATHVKQPSAKDHCMRAIRSTLDIVASRLRDMPIQEATPTIPPPPPPTFVGTNANTHTSTTAGPGMTRIL